MRERREKMILLILSPLPFNRELNSAKGVIKRYDFLHPFKRTVCYSGQEIVTKYDGIVCVVAMSSGTLQSTVFAHKV